MTKSLNLWLVNIVLSAFFMSCDDKTDSGIVLQPDSSILTTSLIDTFTVNFSTVYEKEDIYSSDSDLLLVGAYTDTYVGAVESYPYFQLVPESENTLGSNFVCDSVVMTIKLAFKEITNSDNTTENVYHYYGNVNSAMELEVFQITEDFKDVDTKEYTTLDVLSTNSVREGTSGNNVLDPTSSTTIKIYLDKSTYGQLALDNYSDIHETFLSTMKGLMIKAANGTDAYIAGFETSSDDTYVDIFYHNDTDNDKSVRLIMNNAARRFNHIEGDLAGTDISSLSNAGDTISSSNTNNKTYLQTSTGVRTLMEVPHLKSFINDHPNILINKVELILPIDKTTVIDGTTDAPPLLLSLHEVTSDNLLARDSDGDVIFITNEGDEIGTDKNTVYYPYDEDEQYYRMNLGLYLQDYLINSSEEFRIIISPYGEGIYVNRGILLNDKTSGDKATFKFYYTERDK